MPLPIEDYAIIGDTSTVALVGRDGSIDWLCLPRFDSPAAFAALLGDESHGRWLVGPLAPPGREGVSCARRYVGDSAVLESTYTTATGTVRVTDVMPVADHQADIVRRVEGVAGTVRMRHEWAVRLGYGSIRPWVHRLRHNDEQMISAVAGPDRLVLRGDRLPRAEGGVHVDEFDVAEGETLTFSLTWLPSHLELPDFAHLGHRMAETHRISESWAQRSHYSGPHEEAVTRSLITLRLMTHSETGGIVAAPTTSLPEEFGGERNWDYRFCWLRDAALTLGALLRCGYRDEVQLWRHWLLRAVAGDPEDLQIMYAVDGGRDLPERTLEHLPGYAGSRPVRIGNGAVGQVQHDVVGEVMHALELARGVGVPDDEDSWALQRAMVGHLATNWREPDSGLWEIRGPARHFVQSKVLVWTAFDRAVRAVEEHGLPGPADEWRAVRDEVRAEILERGVDRERGTFTQHYDTTEVDASLLVLPKLGFIAGDDPLMLGTIRAIEEDLMDEGFLRRYRTQTDVDGITGDENPFLACSFWLVSAYVAAGRVDDARALMDRLVGLCNDVGLLSEEYDPRNERFAGTFPQAFSHLTLVDAAVDLAAVTAES